ncbi:MAG: hypothetical protein IT209_04890 [Armatimonadetes bacterium]|nr:hypothetical protein [Armatimonadota bacterium]
MKQITQKTAARSPETTRRGFLRTALAAAFGGVSGAAAWAREAVEGRSLKTDGEVLKQRVSLGVPPVEPLDTMIHFQRSDDNNGRAMTHEILSLSHEEKGKNSYPWTVYAHLDTHHEQGDACVLCSRLHKYGPGWSAGLHSEVFAHNRAVALGVNVEMFNDYTGSEATRNIGVNVQSISCSPKPCDFGMQIHGDGGFTRAINIDSKGDVAIDVNGSYKTGIDLHGKEIRLGDGGSILLDEKDQVRLRYHNGAIEIWKGDRRAAFLTLSDNDRRL